MIQSRAQFGYRGVIVPLFATLFTYVAFNVADQVLMSQGLHAAFGWCQSFPWRSCSGTQSIERRSISRAGGACTVVVAIDVSSPRGNCRCI
jgi:purine-cytosine permease-like protein